MDARQTSRIDQILDSYDRRKQEETRQLVERARQLEEQRQQGAELFRQRVLSPVREAASRIQQAGHEVVLDEMLDAYPPSVRLHVWVKPGPLDEPGQHPRHSLEMVWGDPAADLLCVKRWTSDGLDRLVHQDQARPAAVDHTWVREQIHTFLSVALAP